MMVRLLVATLVCVGSWGHAWAGYAEGDAAFQRKDYATAFREFSTAAAQGNAQAQGALGLLYLRGLGVAEDLRQAEQWFRKSANQGQPGSQWMLGTMYDSGVGLPKDDEQAVFWFRIAALNGNDRAQLRLGAKLAEGEGVAKDEEEAAIWYGRAADQGNADAQHNLGLIFRAGRGAPKDDQKSLFWFRKAAEQGVVSSQGMLGLLYSDGVVVPKDDQQSAFWYRQAAEQGEWRAQSLLAGKYLMGEGVPRDAQQAYFWLLLAASRADANAASLRDSVERTLSPRQRAEAQAAAREWKPKIRAQVEPFKSVAGTGATTTPVPVRLETTRSTGSGFFATSDRIVTNHHVTDGCTRLTVLGQPARLIASEPRSDLALVEVDGGSPNIASIRVGKVALGELTAVAGFPLNGLLSGLNVTTGIVSSLSGIRGDTRLLQITAPVQAGNSGGPLLDASGNVIGVVVSKLDAAWVAKVAGDVPQNVNFAIRSNVLASFLDANGVDYRSSQAGSKLSTQQVASRSQAFTVLVECWK